MSTYNGFSFDAIQQAFNAVKDPTDWKAPINTTITEESIDIVVAAIEFYTATVPNVVMVDLPQKRYRVTSQGYRNGPAGDH